VRAQVQGVISDGQALIEHGKVMTELSDLPKRRSNASMDETLGLDTADTRAVALRMGETGQQLVTGGQQLVDFADALTRSITR